MFLIYNILNIYTLLNLFERLYEFTFYKFGALICSNSNISVEAFYDFHKFMFVCYEIVAITIIINLLNKFYKFLETKTKPS